MRFALIFYRVCLTIHQIQADVPRFIRGIQKCWAMIGFIANSKVLWIPRTSRGKSASELSTL
jgi:hypothetical protein